MIYSGSFKLNNASCYKLVYQLSASLSVCIYEHTLDPHTQTIDYQRNKMISVSNCGDFDLIDESMK